MFGLLALISYFIVVNMSIISQLVYKSLRIDLERARAATRSCAVISILKKLLFFEISTDPLS